MSKPMYRLVDGKGRVLIPKSMREAAKLEYGDIVCLGMAGGKITVRKVEVIEVGDQSPEAVEAYVRTAFQFMPDSLRLDLIGELSRLLQKKGGVRSCRNSQKRIVCRQKRRYLSRTGWWFFPQRYYQSITRGSFFSVRISRKQKIPDIPLPIWFLYLLGSMALLEQGCGWCAATRTVGGKGTAPALPDPSIWGAGFTWTFPRIFWIQFSAGWSYASGVWLANPEEVWSYVMMQKDYQYRILICDRDDFAVLEMLEGRMIFPDVQSLEQFQQAQKDGGMEMI